MTISYQVRMEDHDGLHVQTFGNFTDPTDGGGAGLDYVLNVSSDSSCLLTVPAFVDIDKFQIDFRLLPMRSIHGRPFYNDNQACYLIRRKTITKGWYRFGARHANELLDRRAVAYDSNTSFANKGPDNAGDVIKAYVDQNMGNTISGANRDVVTGQTDLETPGYIRIESDKGDGQSISKTTDRGSLLGVVQDVANDSTAAGTYMSFGFLYEADKSLSFVTRAGQWGSDKRAGQPGQVILAPERGNMGEWRLDIDHMDEVTVAIAGGRGQNDERIIVAETDTTRLATSPFNWRERYYDATNADTTALVQAVARARLREGEPKITLTCDLIETPNTTRGIHFDLGDIITARVKAGGQPMQFDFRVDTIYVSVRKGQQSTRCILTSPI